MMSVWGDVGGKAPPLQEKVKMEVERRKKLRWVMRGVESDFNIGVGVTMEVRIHCLKRKLK